MSPHEAALSLIGGSVTILGGALKWLHHRSVKQGETVNAHDAEIKSLSGSVTRIDENVQTIMKILMERGNQ